MSQSKSWSLALLAVLLVAGWWFHSSNATEVEPLEARPSAVDAASPPPSEARPKAASVLAEAVVGSTSAAAPRLEVGFALLVVDEARRPLEGARLVVQLDDGRTRAGQTSKYVHRRDAAASRDLGASGDDGRIVLAAAPMIAEGAAAWIVHAECVPRRLGAVEAAAWPAEVVLRRATLVEYAVLDPGGLPVADALVRVAPRPRGTGQTRGTTPGVVQAARTDARGVARLPRQEPGTIAWAELDELASAPRPVADEEARVELVLGPTFVLHGTVRFPPGAERSRATVVPRTFGEAYHDHGGIEVRDDGGFGPVRMPVVAGDGFSVQVDAMKHWGECLVLAPPPVAGSVVRHDFVLEPAMALFVTVVDAQGSPVAGALVATRNQQGAHSIATEGVTDAEGKIVLRGSAPGELQVVVEAEGHAPFAGSFHQDKSGYSTTVVLESGWSLGGRVLLEGAPAQEYVLQWRCEGASSGRHRLVQGARDGRFRLPSLARSSVSIAASRADGWRSEWTDVRPPDSPGPVEVELELLPPKPELVRVVDADTNAPVGAARVEVWAMRGATVAGSTDEVASTNAAGEARVRGWRDGETWLVVAAAGYANFEGAATRDAQGGLAPLRLQRTASLLVEVEGWESLPEPRWIWLPDMSGVREPLVGGRCLVEGLRPGWERVVLQAGDEGRHLLQRVLLQPGVQARQAWDLRGLEPLRLRFESDGSELRLGLVVAKSAGHDDWVHARPGIDECVVWRRGAPVELEVLTHDQRPLLRLQLDEEDLRADPLVVRLPRQLRRLLLVDEDDAPLAVDNGWICAPSTAQPCVGRIVVERGVVGLHEDPGARIACEAAAYGRELWSWSEFAFDPDEDGVQRLRAPQACAIELRAEDEGTAVEGASVEVRSLATGNRLLSLALDGQGGGSFRATCGVPLELSWSGAGLWPGSSELRAAEGRSVLPVRRLGSLELELRRAGALLAGESVELLDEASGARVADWIAAGACRGELRADRDGVVRLVALPRGRYRWRLLDSSGAWAEGECRVVAGRSTRATLSAP